MKRLLPLLLAVIGLAGGTAAGLMLRPAPDDHETASAGHADTGTSHAAKEEHGEDTGHAPAHDYVKLNNQFVVPVVEDGRVSSLVILSITLEVTLGARETVFQREPKLRDAFLKVLFAHANAGGFRGNFTDANRLDLLRRALREAAQKDLGPEISDVLIVDIVRQDN